MDLEKVYKDFNWHPSDGDYRLDANDNNNKKSGKPNKKIQIHKFIIFSVFVVIIIIGILISK